MKRVHARLPWVAGGLALSFAAATWLAGAELQRQQREFDTGAGIVHRVLSLRAIEHEAVLATLALLDSPAAADAARRLPAIYPRILAVLRREGDAVWADAHSATGLAKAEAESRRAGRAWGLVSEMERGRLWLVLAGEEASHALQIDLAGMLTDADWPFAADAPMRRCASNSLTPVTAGASMRGPMSRAVGDSCSTRPSPCAASPSTWWASGGSAGTSCPGQ